MGISHAGRLADRQLRAITDMEARLYEMRAAYPKLLESLTQEDRAAHIARMYPEDNSCSSQTQNTEKK